MDILSEPVLVLNASFMPISIKPVRDAICMILLDKAQVIKSINDTFIRSEKLKIPVPRIISIASYYQSPFKKPKPNRQNIFQRDNYTCVYCNKKVGHHKLTMDHIVPRSRWHLISKDKKPAEFNSWENLVTACRSCNTKKGNKLLSELKWKFPEIKKLDYRFGMISFISPKTCEKYGWTEYLNGY